MLQISTWSRALVALILLAGIVIALPNIPGYDRLNLPSWLPHDSVSLGLDLQGGSYLLLQVDFNAVEKNKTDQLLGDLRTGLRKAHILYDKISADGDTVQVHIKDPASIADAAKLIDGLNPSMTSSLLAVGPREYDVTQPGGGLFVMRMSDGFKTLTQTQVLAQSVTVVSKRVDEMGTKEPTVAPSPPDRVLVEVPGLQDPARLKELVGKTAQMTFQLDDENVDPNSANIPAEDEVLPMANQPKNGPVQKIVVQKLVMVQGERLTDAAAGFDQQTGAPDVTLRFDSLGARQFGDVTRENVRKRFAIVLDKQVIMNATIEVPILNGAAQITGIGTSQDASDLAILLRAGALPAPLKIIEESTIGAELGADSVNAGRLSAIAGLVLVALFMIGRYGLFGLFADIALTFNVVLLLAVLTETGASLSLPGIAGIVLTMGMAVDANVLIFERIREEQRNGRSMLASIDTGFRRAMATIIDANMTHVIASLILFLLGTGSVRGFAVTLGVGIVTSFFTAVMVTRLIVVTWLNMAKPRKLAI